MLTVKEVAIRFKVKESTVKNWLIGSRTPVLESFRVGRVVRITEAAVVKFIEDSGRAAEDRKKKK